jgi:hypothetical protein
MAMGFPSPDALASSFGALLIALFSSMAWEKQKGRLFEAALDSF